MTQRLFTKSSIVVCNRYYTTSVPSSLSVEREQLKTAYNLFTEKKFMDSYQAFVNAIDAFEDFHTRKQTTKDDEHLMAIGYNNLAETLRYMLKGGYNSPVHPKYSFASITKLYTKAEEIWSNFDKNYEVDSWKGTLQNNMGLYYMETARNFPSALTHFLKSSEIRRTLLDALLAQPENQTQIDLPELRSHLAVTFNNIGQCYVNMRQPKQAMPYFDNAKYLFDQRDPSDDASSRIYVVVLNNIGLTLYEMNKYNDAFDHFAKALHVLSKGSISNGEVSKEQVERLLESGAGEELGVTLNNLGTVMYMKSNFAQSEHYLRLSLDVFERVFSESPNHKHIATTCTQLALTLREKHSKMPRPEKDLLRQNATSVLSKMGWNPFKSTTETTTSSELTEEQKDYNESKDFLERAKKIASIHKQEHEQMEKQRKEEQKQSDKEAKRFKGTSMFSKMLSRKS